MKVYLEDKINQAKWKHINIFEIENNNSKILQCQAVINLRYFGYDLYTGLGQYLNGLNQFVSWMVCNLSHGLNTGLILVCQVTPVTYATNKSLMSSFWIIYVTVVWSNRTSSVPKSVHCCLSNKESNFFSGILNFLVNFQDFTNKSSTNELNNVYL